MDSQSVNKNYNIVPAGEIRCIWMTAGIISYHLCDRDYNCDDCPLDIAMRKHCIKRPLPKTNFNTKSTFEEDIKLRDDFYYSTNHCWIKKLDNQRLRIGIEPNIVSALLIPKAIVLPSIRQKVLRQQLSIWIILDEGTFPLASPIDGNVVSTNKRITDDPLLLLRQPFDEGWLYEVESDNFNSDEFMNADNAQKYFAQISLRFRETLIDAMKSVSPNIGLTLADGGVALQSISDMLGTKKYFKIMRESFR